jgi:hypothetical protein
MLKPRGLLNDCCQAKGLLEGSTLLCLYSAEAKACADVVFGALQVTVLLRLLAQNILGRICGRQNAQQTTRSSKVIVLRYALLTADLEDLVRRDSRTEGNLSCKGRDVGILGI